MQMATSIEADNGEMIVKRVSVPIGLEELMEGLTKEVILKKPKDICVFASEYFANLLNLREQGSMKGPPGRRIQSITKQISPNNISKQLKTKSKSVDHKILARQTSIQLDSPTKRTLTTKKIVLNSKEEKDKAAEKTKNFLDRRKARKGSKDENNKISRQASLGQNDKRERRTSRTSSTSTESSMRSPRKSSQSEIREKRSSSKSDKPSPRKSVDLMTNVGKIAAAKETESEDNKADDSERLSNKESTPEKEDGMDVSDTGISEPQKSEDVVGCTMKCEGAVDTIAENVQELKLATPTDVEEIMTAKVDNEHLKIPDEGVTDNSVDEVDQRKNKVVPEDTRIEGKLERTEELKTDNQDLHKSEEPQTVETSDNVSLVKEEVEDESTVKAEDKENVENQAEVDKSVNGSEETKTKSDISEDLSKLEPIETEKGGAPNDEISLTKDEEENKNIGEDIKDESNAEINKNEEIIVSDKEQNEITPDDLKPDEEKLLQNDQENKENIDTNKEDNVHLDAAVIPAAAGILANVEIKNSDKIKDTGKLKNNRTKSSEETKDYKADSKKVKRVKSVDSSMKTLKKTKSKSRLTSANEENTDDVSKARSKRSASVDVVQDRTPLEESQQNNFNSVKLREEIKEVDALSKATVFKTSYNPYKLRQEIKQASGDAQSNETGMSKVVSELAAAVRIQSIWRGFKARKQLKNGLVSTNQKPLEEAEKESEKSEDKIDNDTNTVNQEERGVVENEESEIVETAEKAAVDVEEDNEKKRENETKNEEDAKKKSSMEDQIVSVQEHIKDHNEEIKDGLKIATPTEENKEQVVGEKVLGDSVEDERDVRNVDDTASKEDEKQIENGKPDVDENQSNESSTIADGKLGKTEEEDNKKSDDKDGEKTKDNEVTVGNDTKEEEIATTAKDKTEESIEEEITKKLTSGLNLASTLPLINDSENIVKQIQDPEATKSAKPKDQLDTALAVLRIQALWRGFKIRKQLKHEKVFGATVEKEPKSKEDLEIMTRVRAVAKIQAFWRRYLVRKNVKEVNKRLAELQKPAECDEMPSQRELSDEDVFKAAAKIQAGVRGYMVRKKGDVCHLNSISEETTPELRVPDEEVIQSLEKLQSVPSDSPELQLSKEEAGNEREVKNNAAPNTEGDNKKPENEVKFIASELNSSTTNKLSSLDTSAIIDESISKSSVNKDAADPDSSVIHDEPGYEDAPTRPATSDTEPKNNQTVEAASEADTKENVANENENELNKANKLQGDKQRFFSSQESTTSVDSVATVIFNDTETKPVAVSEEEGDGRGSTDKQGIKSEEAKDENIQEEKTEAVKVNEENQENEDDGLSTTNNLKEDSVENAAEVNNNSHDVKAEAAITVDNNMAEMEKEYQLLSKENKEINDQGISDVNMEENDKNVLKEKSTTEISHSDLLDSKNEDTEETSSDEAMNQSLTTSDHNKINISTLENEIKNSAESIEKIKEKSVSEDSCSKEASSSENTLNDAIVSQLSLENVNNKLNVAALETEIGNSNQRLQDLAARSSEELSENLDNDGKESSVEVSTTEDTKTENSWSPRENVNEVEDKGSVQSGKDILRIHIPLRELSEIKEEDGDGKSLTESGEDLEDESSVNQETPSKSEDEKHEPIEVEVKVLDDDSRAEAVDDAKKEASKEDKDESPTLKEASEEDSKVKDESPTLVHEEFFKAQAVEEGPRQKSPVATISLGHSGEFHDMITVPISLTPPTTASSKEGESPADVRQPSPPGLVNTGELHDNVLPLSVQLNEAPPGAKILTSHVSESVIGDGQDRAQASNKDASTCEAQPDNTTSSAASMETGKRNNASTLPKKNMEAEAATKIQAGFRGYQVRKQLKNKISSPGDISNQRRSARRKSSGRTTESGRITQNKSKPPSSDVEEKSAVKIQAGVRGFLVRRRQKKQTQGKESS